MAEEEEKKVVLLDSISISERRKMFREERVRRKGLREEPLLRTTLLKATYKHMSNIPDVDDYVPAIGVILGGYSRFTGKDVTVTACFSYETQRLHWEIVEGPLRRRLCVHWSRIAGLDLKLNESGVACLTVEMRSEVFPQCLQYSPESNKWSAIVDFTDEEKYFNYPPHYVIFKPGTVDESYAKLLNYRKEEDFIREKHQQRFQEQFQKQLQKKQLQKKLRKKLRKLSTSKSEKEENK